ncbi:MAG: non-canonical purine NTP diphosphatase [Flavobacteriaceae bacterium]
MKKIVFATHNKNKLKEVQALLPHYQIIGLDDIGCHEEIEENASDLQGNALIKANHVFENYGLPCFADDTGLEVEALNGAPGVYSARYAGKEANSENNMNKLLKALEGIENRRAQFRTVIALVSQDRKDLFEGICEGSILKEKQGIEGFGYDPIFQPKGFKTSFAQMSMDQKGEISHRGRAIKKLVQHFEKGNESKN